jgi:hypothetical protein
MTANVHGVSLWDDENILELVVMFAQPCEYTEKPLNMYIKWARS